MAIKPTPEGQTIIDAIKNTPKVAVVAVPGSGKTTLLEFIANHYGSSSILGLAFNSSIAKENSKRFPSNTTFKTTHSMAYRWYKDKHKGTVSLDNLRPIMLKSILGMRNDTKYNILVAIQKAFDDYCLSSSTASKINKDDAFMSDVNDSLGNNIKTVNFVVKMANMLLRIMRGEIESESDPFITHNFYLKEFHLGLVRNNKSFKTYDIVMLDEAQDATAIAKAIFEALPGKRKIMVGDPDQQLYSFIGAINALRTLEEDGYTMYPLTASFRMPPGVADRCNNIIQMVKGYDPKVEGLAEEPDGVNKTTAFIFRTNGRLINWMLKAINKDFYDWTSIRDPKSIFSTALDISMMNIWYIEGKTQYDIKPKDFNNKHLWFIYKDFLEDTNRVPGSSLYSWLIKTYGEKDREIKTTVNLILNISKMQEENEDSPGLFELFKIAQEQYKQAATKEVRVSVTTAHTSKGLEFDKVILGDDFYKPHEVVAHELLLHDDAYDKLFGFYEKLFKDNKLINDDNMSAYSDASDSIEDLGLFLAHYIVDTLTYDKCIEITKKLLMGRYHQYIKENEIYDWGKVDEINLVFVASSRAKKELSMADDMGPWENPTKMLEGLFMASTLEFAEAIARGDYSVIFDD